MLEQLNKGKIFRKVRALVGATALFVLLLGMTVQAAETTKKWYANREEWEGRTGYHLGAVAQTKSCGHSADDYSVIAVSINGSGLMPDKTYLKDNFKVRGATNIMSEKYKSQLKNSKITWETADVPGLDSHLVSGQVAKIKINGRDYTLAGPYWCPDGYAGYAYFRYYFSNCSNTGEFYFVSSEHEWLGCARGDIGFNEYHPREYTHNIYKYNVVPNEYTIAYNGNGYNSGNTNSQSATYDESLNLQNNGFKRTGYVFTEWNTKKDGSGTSYSPKQAVKNLTATDGGKITLYAQWKISSYTVAYDGNGATSGSLADQKPKYGQEFNLRKNAYKKSGYTFTGWNTKKGGTGTSYTAEQKVKNLTEKDGATVTLYAQWKANSYTVTYNGNGATSGSLADQKPKYGQEFNLRKNGYEKTGYTFTGWNTKAGGNGTSYTENQKVKNLIEKDNGTVVLYAQWKANSYTIRFDGNGATDGAMEDITAAFDQEIQLPENLFTRTTEQGESIFIGWNQNPDVYETEFTNEETIKNLSAEEGTVVVLYAIWDDCPQIDAYDRHFNLWWAQNGKITEEELLRTASAVDREDQELENRTLEEIENVGLPGSLSLFDYDAEAFTAMTEGGTVDLTYQAVDSAGNTVYETVQVHVYSTDSIPIKEIYTRFINRTFYKKSFDEGGLHPNSIWRTDPEYKAVLEESLDNMDNDTPIATYSFTREEVEEAKEYVTEHGIGNSKEPDALQNFYDRFMR